ncbi:MAG: Gfo/Idh/MocA family oxidoreductase [Parvularculaceae bacterium]|nr:Gfo/Idh/MocA family oxidoreductase [Parvularculaceae bacterium]
MSREIVAGVAGAGVFGSLHASKYLTSPDVRLAAVLDRDAGRAEALAEKCGARAFTDLKEFLNAVDVVTVATCASSHFNVARAALECGRHVLVEKPIALTLAHADRLIRIARDRHLVLQVGHQERFVFDAFGIFGRRLRPRSVSCVRRNPVTGRGEDVSVVFDLMIHDIDLVRRMGFSDPVSLAAFGHADEADAKFTFADGATVTFEASRLASVRERRMTLDYGVGVVEIDFVNRKISNTTGVETAATFDHGGPALADPLGFGVARFLDAVRGVAPPAISGDDGRDALEWALMIEKEILSLVPAKRSVTA